MTDHTVDPQLLSQIEELRQLLSRSLQQHPSLVARCVALTQRLDQVAVHLHQNPSDESTAWRALAEIGAALSDAQRALPSASPAFDLLRETLPPQPRLDAQLLNQAQLVQHLSTQPHTLDAAQGALREYAEQHQRQPQAASPHPGALQAALSAQITQRAADGASLHESRLVSSRDLGHLQRALSTSSPLADLDPNQPHISSSGDLQHDLRALADRYLSASTLPTSTEDLVLARIEADDRGNIRNVHLHAVQALQAARPQAPTPAAAPASPITEATQAAFHNQAAVDLLRRRLSTMRRDLDADRAATSDAHAAFAAEQRRLVALESLSADAQRRLQALSADAQQRDAAEQAIAATRDAASQTLQDQTSHLAQTAQSFIQSLQQQAQQATGPDRQALLALRDNVDQWLQNPALQNPTPQHLQQHASSLHTLISQSHAAAPASSQPLLHHLAHQAADTSDRAAAIASTLSWSPLSDAPAPTAAPVPEVDLHAARSLVASHASRFQSAAYAASTSEDRLLAVEQPFASFLRDLPPTSRASLPSLSLSAPASSPAPTQSSLNLSAITAQSAAHLHKLRGLTPGALQPPSVNVYADAAGLELPRAASAALSTSDAISSSGAEIVDRSLQRALFHLGESTRQAQQLAASVAHLSATRSGQRDLGFSPQDGSSPLFKRKIGVSKEGKVGDVFLPALREVSGIAPNTPRLPADASERGELALGQRAEAGAVSDRQTQLLGALERVFQQMLPGAQTTSLVSDAVQSAAGAQRALSRFERASSARTQSPRSAAAQDNARETQDLTKALRSEAQSVSHDVISKLGPILSEVGVDFGSIRLYNGPRAAQLADAMGAHAFAMGKHIFGRMDLSTIQGLSVFAHEATHTTHYDDTTSVSQKEQEAEAVERKAVQHLSRGRYELALEPPTQAATKGDGALRASGMRGLLDAAAPNPNDLLSTLSTGGSVSHILISRVSEVIMKRMKRELTTDAERVGTRPR
jgi:hypothetical protein